MRIFGLLRTLDEEQNPVNYYRTTQPLAEMGKHGIGITFIDAFLARPEIPGEIPPKADDIYTGCRVYTQGSLREFIDNVHRDGGIWVFDADDDLTESYRLVSGYGESFKIALQEADFVTTTTPELARHFTRWTQLDPMVIPNYLEENFHKSAWAARTRRVYAPLTVGFSGKADHWQDWKVASTALARIARLYPTVNVLLQGSAPMYMKHLHPVAHLPPVPYSQYPAQLAQFDILLCAVDPTDPFNHGKSDVKAVEAMAAGAVAVCSRTRDYVRLHARGAPIVLVEEETRDCWMEALDPLIRDEDYRAQFWGMGYKWVHNHRDIAVNIEERARGYASMIYKTKYRHSR